MTLPGRDAPPAPPPRGRVALVVLVMACVLASAGFGALGVWQLERLAWKRALIERVASRVEAPPVAAPGRAEWPAVSAARDEYRPVRLRGHFLMERDSRVQALTELGRGYWILTPFLTTDGDRVLVNRGFVPEGWAGDVPPAVTEVSGLLRLSEPGGRVLRRNDPAADRWYSRELPALAAARGLGPVAPFFVDMTAFVPRSANADGPPGNGMVAAGSTAWPRTGLTLLRFRNHHLGYALTWFALALMSAGAAVCVVRDTRRFKAPGLGPLDARDHYRD